MKNLNYSFGLKNLLILFALGTSVFMTSCSDDDPMLSETSYEYSFHNGQTVPTAPYAGLHPSDLSVSLALSELDGGGTRITVTLMNTLDGETYRIHAHDAADPMSTPNGTPYNESPNMDILAQNVEGNGATVSVSQETDMDYDELTMEYEGFFVVHDPLQAISTVDISTYLIVGSFARTQSSTNFQSAQFNYSFNEGQLVPEFAYSGMHSNDLSATINVDELADGRSRITVMIDNTIDGEVYRTHAHDMADASTTPNGTPYIETPNQMVFAAAIDGNGSRAGQARISDMSYTEITGVYDGFFVIHDPLQALSTVDPTTYVVLGVFAR